MSIKNFFAFLTPTLDKGRIMETLENTKESLINDSLQPYKDAVQFAGYQGPMAFKTPEVKRFNDRFRQETGTRTNYVETTTIVLSTLAEGFPYLEKAIENHFKGSAAKLGLTYQKATLLRVISMIGFASRYARRVLHYTYSRETPAAFKGIDNTPAFKAGEVKWLEENAVSFARLIKLFAEPMPKILAKIDSVPDIVFDESKVDAVESVTGPRKLDPLGLGFVPVISDIIWFFGSRWVEHQAAVLQEARDERAVLELRLAQLRAARDGNPDAASDKVIKVTEERLRNLNYEVVRLEKEYGVAS